MLVVSGGLMMHLGLCGVHVAALVSDQAGLDRAHYHKRHQYHQEEAAIMRDD
jgi:hypothetical protein